VSDARGRRAPRAGTNAPAVDAQRLAFVDAAAREVQAAFVELQRQRELRTPVAAQAAKERLRQGVSALLAVVGAPADCVLGIALRLAAGERVATVAHEIFGASEPRGEQWVGSRVELLRTHLRRQLPQHASLVAQRARVHCAFSQASCLQVGGALTLDDIRQVLPEFCAAVLARPDLWSTRPIREVLPRPPHFDSKKRLAQIVQWRADKVTIGEIASRLHISTQRVKQLLARTKDERERQAQGEHPEGALDDGPRAAPE